MVEVLEIASSGGQWDERVKAGAYEVYAHQCNGDMVCTLEVLANRDGPKIPEKTVYDWRKRYGWERKLQAEREAIAPYSWNLYFGGLAVAALDSLKRLHRIVQDDEANPRDQVAAARAIGQLVVSHIERIEARLPEPDPPASLDTLTTEELVALTEQRPAGE